jgi:hypothetical protein
MEKKDIFEDSGIPEDIVAFFRKYQKSKGKEAIWYGEPNGRFAMNFRYYIIEGMKKDLPDRDLLVAAAILLSHHESFFRYVTDPEYGKKTKTRNYEIGKIHETIDELSKYMGKHGSSVADFSEQPVLLEIMLPLRIKFRLSARLTTAGISAIRYRKFFQDMPRIWGYAIKKLPA